MQIEITSKIWGSSEDRKSLLVPLPVGCDGVHCTVPITATKTEARFLAALVGFASNDAIEKAIEYAISDRA